MRTAVLASLVAAAVAVAGGCATTHPAARVDDARLARLPPETREALLDKNHDVDVARSNVAAAQVALADARQFRSAVQSEQAAARNHVDAAHKSSDLANRNPNGTAAIDDAQKASSVARERLDAAGAKMRYADDLVSLRGKEVDLRQAQADAAQANVELQRYDQLAAANQAGGLAREDFVRTRERAQSRASQLEQKVAELRAKVESGETAWRQQHDKLQASAKDSGDVGLDAPPPPQPIRQ